MPVVAIEEKQYKEAIELLEPVSKRAIVDTLPTKKARTIDHLGFAS
jgi:hypothetical protein